MWLSPDFFITAFLVVISPGSGALYTLTTGLTRGAKTSLIAATGCTLGIIPHALAAVTGLAALLHTSPLAFEMIRYAGAVWLLYLAWSTIRNADVLQFGNDADPQSASAIILHAVLINLLNPKLPLFFLAFLPQFVSQDSTFPAGEMLILSGIFMLMTLAIFILYGVFSAAVRYRLLARPGILTTVRYGFAAAFAGLSVKLMISQH